MTETEPRSLPGDARPVPDRRAVVLRALSPALVFVGVRLAGLLVLAAMATRAGSDLGRRLTTWDGAWLLAIAEHGYSGVPPDMLDAFGNRTDDTPFGFFPGYPGLVGVLNWLLPGDVAVAGLVVSAVAGLVAAYGLTRLGEQVPGGSRRAGLLLTALFAATPMSVVLSMTYTEALFSALAVWALVAVLDRRWLVAGLLAAAGGLVRPTATALVAAVGLAAVVTAVAARESRDDWRPWAGALLATTGLLGYLGYVGLRTGAADGWFTIQREGWGWYLDGGFATAEYLWAVLIGGERVFDVLTLLAFVGSLVLLAITIWMRLPLVLVVYGGLTLVTIWGTEGLMNAKLRLLVPAFTLLLPVALGLAKRRPGTAVAVVVACALGSAWFGGYALTIWRYGI